MTTIIYLPRSYVRPVASALRPPDLTWLALALAFALAGLLCANLAIAAGLAVVTALNLAVLPACLGLGIALAVFHLEVSWSARV